MQACVNIIHMLILYIEFNVMQNLIYIIFWTTEEVNPSQIA